MQKLNKLNLEIEKLAKRLNDTSDLHRNLKLREKKLENNNKELMYEIEEYKKMNLATENEFEQYKQKAENDLIRVEFQLKQMEEERDEKQSEIDKNKTKIKSLQNEIDEMTVKMSELEKNIEEA